MTNLLQEASRFVSHLDSVIERFEDTDERLSSEDQIYYSRLKRIFVKAEIRKYRRITCSTAFQKFSEYARPIATVLPEPKIDPVAEAESEKILSEAAKDAIYKAVSKNPWLRPYMSD